MYDGQYNSQTARDAQERNYGDASYWQYLDRAAAQKSAHYARKGDNDKAAEMWTRSLSEALVGNEGD